MKTLVLLLIVFFELGCSLKADLATLLNPPPIELVEKPPITNSSTSANLVISGICAANVNSFEILQPEPAQTVHCINGRWTAYLDVTSNPDGALEIRTDQKDPKNDSTISFIVKKDTVPPAVSSLILESGATLTNKSEIAYQIVGSEVAKAYITEDSTCATGGSWQPASGVVPVASGDGLKGFYVMAQDLAGNISPCVLGGTIVLDQTPPVVLGLADDFVTRGSKSWTWSCSDANAPCEYRYQISSAVTLAPVGVYGLTQSALKSGDGLFYVNVQAKDAAGNESVIKSVQVTLSSTLPNIAIEGNASFYNSNSVSLQLTNINGFDEMEISNSPACASPTVTSPSGTMAWNLTAGDGLKTVYYLFRNTSTGAVTDCASASITIDTVIPSLALTTAASDPFRSATFSVNANFSESVTGFSLSDIVVTNGTASGLSGSGSSYTFTVTPTAQGLVSVDVASAVAVDVAGNGNTGAATLARTFDNIQPTLALSTGVPDPTNSSLFSVTATFSEPVTGFTLADIGVTNAVVSALAGSGTTYTFNVAPASPGTVRLAVGASAAADSAGNGNTAAVDLVRVYDGDGPSLVLSTTAPLNFNTANFNVNAAFSEAVTGFTLGDIVVTNGTASSLTGSGDSYTFTVTPSGQGLVTVAVAAAVAKDAANNDNTAATNLTRTYDSLQPSLVLSTASSAFNTSTVTVTATFSESVSGFALSDIVVTNGTASSLVGTGASYSFTLTPTAEGPITVAVDAAAAVDPAGNQSTAASTLNLSYDVTAPSLVLTTPAPAYFGTSSIVVTATFSEPVVGFSLADVAIVNGTASSLSGSGATYSFVVTPSTQGQVIVSAGAGVVTDPAGNSNTAATDLDRIYDSGPPTLILSSAAPSVFNTASISVTATFNEAVTGFDAADVGVTNGSVSGFAGSGTTYTFTVTPAGQGLVTVAVASGVAFDVASNGNTAATNLTRTYDSVQPSLVLSSAAAAEFNSATISVTATFSESVTGFALADINVTNGTASSLSGSGTTYSFTVTPAGQGLVTVAVAAGVASDSAGNLNTAAVNLTRTYDSVAPTITGLSNDATWLKTKTWTWGCSETCSYRFVVDTVSNTTPTGVFAGTTTASQNSGSGTYYLHVQAQDGAGNVSIVHVSAKLDNTVPVAPASVVDQVAISSLASSPVITFTSGSDANSGLNKHQARVIKASDSSAVSSWVDFTSGATLSGLSLLTNTSYKVQVVAIDNVGNTSASAVSDGWVADTTAPGLATSLTVGAVPASATTSPVLSWTAASDGAGGSGIQYHEARVFRTSDNAVMAGWVTLSSGNAVSGMTLTDGVQYYFKVRARDVAGNIGNESGASASWTANSNPCTGNPPAGTVCPGGALFVGSYNGSKYMTTPGGCTDSATPTCNNSADFVTKGFGTNGTATGRTSAITGSANSSYLATTYADTYAAKYCENMTYGGYSDWFLPALNELALLGTNRASFVGLQGSPYWTSTESTQYGTPAMDQWTIWMDNATQSTATKTLVGGYVRCMRKY